MNFWSVLNYGMVRWMLYNADRGFQWLGRRMKYLLASLPTPTEKNTLFNHVMFKFNSYSRTESTSI